MKKRDFVVKKLKSLKQVRPDSSWLSSQKNFILSEISQAEEKERKPSLVLPLFNFNILKIFKPSFAVALAIIILITSMATVGVISAAQNSLPGDWLYPVKTAFEQTQLTFTPGEANKTKVSIKLATQRMDEFTQLIDKPDKKQDAEKTVKKFTSQLIDVQESIDKLKEKNIEKAAEIAKLVKSQTSTYEETLIDSVDKLAYILPEDKEDLKKNINEALAEVGRTEEMTDELMGEIDTGTGPSIPEEITKDKVEIVPIENVEEAIESESFENLNEELLPQQEE